MKQARPCLSLKHRERGQSTVELAFATLILAVLVVGMVGVTEVLQAQIGLTAVAEEAAHAAALAPSAGLSQQRGRDRGIAVGNGYALRNGSLNVDIQYGAFEAGQQIQAVATYQLTTRDIPLLMAATVNVRREHIEVIPRFRALPAADD
jgi:Flp pilus assembly protein TadG